MWCGVHSVVTREIKTEQTEARKRKGTKLVNEGKGIFNFQKSKGGSDGPKRKTRGRQNGTQAARSAGTKRTGAKE